MSKIHDVYDRLSSYVREKETKHTTTEAAVELDKAESPHSRPNRPEGLLVVDANGGGDQGRSVED